MLFARLVGVDEFYRPKIKVTTFILLISCFYGFVLNYPLVHTLFKLSETVPEKWFPYTGPFLLSFAAIIIFSLFAIPKIIKPFFILLTLTSAVAMYAVQEFRVLFDASMIENVVETNASEALFYLNVRMVLYFVAFGVLPSVLIVWVKLDYQSTVFKEIFSRIALVLIAVIGISLIATTSYKNYASIGRNNKYMNKMIVPAHVYYAYRYVQKNYFNQQLAYTSLGDDAHLEATENKKPTLVILVLGETARSMNFSDNGYEHDTQPYTKNLGMISFQNVSSCGTYTALSVPCMFSNFNRTQYSKPKANAQDNAIDIISKAGVETLWIDNDGGDKGVAHNTRLVKINAQKNSSALCNGETCLDEVMLEPADKFIQQDNKNKLLVLHTIGSHGPTYFQRFPANLAKFAPWCNSKDLQECTDKEITNVYDNTLVYTDYLLSKLVAELKHYSEQYNVALMYISDHGESLGENGLYLHGTPYTIAPKEQKTVPWLVWIPAQYANQKHIDMKCLAKEAHHNNYSHDNFFHSLIGFYGVKTQAKQDIMDIFSICHA
ncbi:MAG: phosphoethanolamine transferase [Vibrio sp.]